MVSKMRASRALALPSFASAVASISATFWSSNACAIFPTMGVSCIPSSVCMICM